MRQLPCWAEGERSPVSPDSSASLFPAVADFLAMEGLSRGEIVRLLDAAARLLPVAGGLAKAPESLAGKLVANIFFEDSTRTRCSFEVAALRLGARVVNLTAGGSSASKGESLLDTALNVEAMGVSAIVVRCAISGGAELVARTCACPVINAGDGRHEHPTQGLLDLATVREAFGSIEGRTVAIVGDVANSRVARSALHGLVTCGARVRLCGPPTLVPASLELIAAQAAPGQVRVMHDLDQALEAVDAVMMLRIQMERSAGIAISSDYHAAYGLTRTRIARLGESAIVLHPGPMNRGVEIDDAVADDPTRSRILRQVTWGVAVRMAVLEEVLIGR